MATFYSEQYTGKYRTQPVVEQYRHRNWLNPIRYAVFTYTQAGNGTIDDFLYLVKVPGDARIIIPECYFYFSAWAATTLLDVGWAAHEDKMGQAVVADFDGLVDGLDIDAAGIYHGGLLNGAFVSVPALFHHQFDARGEVDIVAQFRVAAPTDTDSLQGAIAYII